MLTILAGICVAVLKTFIWHGVVKMYFHCQYLFSNDNELPCFLLGMRQRLILTLTNSSNLSCASLTMLVDDA